MIDDRLIPDEIRTWIGPFNDKELYIKSGEETFINGIESNDREKVRIVPKADLHNHYNLGGNHDYIFKKSCIQIEPLKAKFESFYNMDPWVQERLKPFFKHFNMDKQCENKT